MLDLVVGIPAEAFPAADILVAAYPVDIPVAAFLADSLAVAFPADSLVAACLAGSTVEAFPADNPVHFASSADAVVVDETSRIMK